MYWGIKGYVSTPHQNIWEAVELLQELETNASLSYISARDGGKPTLRCRKDVEKDGKISIFRDKLEHINENGEHEPQIQGQEKW